MILPRNPVTQRRELRVIPTWFENLLGASYYNDVCPISTLAAQYPHTKQVNAVFQRLVAQCDRHHELDFELRIKNDPTVNAFCLPGGKVTITTGMLQQLQDTHSHDIPEPLSFEDKLAAVLGHEIAHACAGHGRRTLQLKMTLFALCKIAAWAVGYFTRRRAEEHIRQGQENRHINTLEARRIRQAAEQRANMLSNSIQMISDIAGYFTILSHSRCHELEADAYGIKLAALAKYKPNGAVWLQREFIKMQGQQPKIEGWFMRWFSRSIDLLSTHPPSEERLQANQASVNLITAHGPQALLRKASEQDWW